MEESDNIIFPILKEVGCELPPTVTSLKGLIDEHVYQIAAGCLQAINADLSTNIPKKFPTSKATKFRVATEVARIIKDLGYPSEIGYQSILYPHEQEVRKIVGFLVTKLPKKESDSIELSGTTSLELRAQTTLQQISPANNHTVFHIGRKQPPMVPFNSVSLVSNSSLNQTGVQISTQINSIVSQRPLFINNQTTTANYWGSFQPRLQMSTGTGEQMHNVRLVPAIIQHNARERLVETRSDERLLPETTALGAKLNAQLQASLSASFKTALAEAKVAKSALDQEKVKKLKSSVLHNENVFSRKAQFAQENTVALASTEPVISAEEQLAQDKAEYEVLVQEREAELTKLHELLAKLSKRYKNLTTNMETLQSNIDTMNNDAGNLDGDLEGLEATHKTRCHVIDFLPNAQDNITKLRQLTETNMAKILKLNAEWDKMRLVMIEEYRQLQQQYDDKKKKFQENVQKLQKIRAEIKQGGVDIRAKEDQYATAVQEYEGMPKNLNRNVFIKRIMDVVKNIDKQNEEIGAILVDIKSVQREITNKGESVKRSFAETDDLVYNTAKAKKSTVAVEVYKDVVALRDGFSTVIATVETIGKKQNIIRELEQSIELIQDRGTLNSFEQVLGDLHAVQAENAELKATLKAAGVGAAVGQKKSKKKKD